MKTTKFRLDDYPELKRAIDAGVNGATLGPLRNWSQEDLKRLIEQCDGFYQEFHPRLIEAYGELALLPQNFLNHKRSMELDESLDRVDFEVLAMCSEICAAAMVFLES